MKRINRRTALAAISASSLSALVAQPSRAADAAADKRELFAIGPFALGDWFKHYRTKYQDKEPLAAGAPEDDQIIKSLNECRLYLIDRRVWADRSKPRFDESKDRFPQVAAEGKLVHSWNEKGGTCTIWVKEMSAKDVRTDCDASPPFRRLDISVGIEILGAGRQITQTETLHFVSEPVIAYDINGQPHGN